VGKMTGPEHNPMDDIQDEDEMFVFVIADLVQRGEVIKAKIHTRSYRDYRNKSLLALLRSYRNTYPLDVYANKADEILEGEEL
jgi:hypothetical protein